MFVRLASTAAVVLGVLLFALAASQSRAGVNAPASPLPDVFPPIAEVRSVHGVARVKLTAVVDPVSGYPTFAYGTRIGEAPTIRVHPGDTIDVELYNAMRPFAGRPDLVNLHFHGLTVSPRAPADDSMVLAHYGETLHYRLRLPRDHEPGLYWYHPHAHGESYYDVTNGMSGAIVVEGLERHLPALASMRERIVVLRDIPTGPGFVDDDMPMTGMAGMDRERGRIRHSTAGPPCRAENGLTPTLNRQFDAHIGIRPGERQFFRVVNAAAARYFDVSVDGSPLELVALDGVALDAYPGARPTRIVTHVRIPPAGRAEFVVTGPDRPTVLRSACVDEGTSGDASPATVLAHLVDPAHPVPLATASSTPEPSPKPVGPPPALRRGAALPHNSMSVPAPSPSARRTIRFTEDAHGFYINGKAFGMNDPPAVVARSGTVEEWTVENATDELHDFHIHQVHFVVEAINGRTVAEREWRDTADVPPQHHGAHAATPGRIRVLMDFRNPVIRGTFFYHCHILDHQDQGMMAKIRVL